MLSLQERQNLDDGDFHPSIWWTTTGVIIKWAVFFSLFVLVMIYIIGGYWHAKRRIARGQAPLAYHRWLVNRRMQGRYDPNYQNPSNYYYNRYNYGPDQYGMHPMPPPMYDPNAPMPPAYQPPEGATKVDPSQRAQPISRLDEPASSSQFLPPGAPSAVH